MHAIIRMGNGEYYISAVFGVYKDTNCKESLVGYTVYYIVFDQKKEKLVRKYLYDQKALKGKGHLLHLMVLDLDYTRERWNLDEDGYGCVEFLNRKEIENYLAGETLPDTVLTRCRELDAAYEYREWNNIETEDDIAQLLNVTGWFHDAEIAKLEQRDDGSLFICFEGIWGCHLEMIFEDDVSFCKEYDNMDIYEPYWLGATLLIDGEYKILLDEEDLTPEDISKGYRWFKAKKIRYRVIPD